MSLKIEKNIPLETVATRRIGWKELFEQMEIGDSFLLESNSKLVSQRAAGLKAASNAGKKLITRTVENGVRFWRVK